MSKGLDVFKITINNWAKHQGQKKKNHRYFLLENRFFQDDKIASLSAVQTRFYLYLLTVAADLTQDSYTLHTNSIPSYFRLRTQSVRDSLIKFEELQLLTYSKMVSNTREDKTKEDKTKQNKLQQGQKKEPNPLNKEIWTAYRDAYFLRYNVEPVRNLKTNANISQLAARLGAEAVDVVKFYLTHNGGFYLQTQHPIGSCLKDCEGLRTQMLRGKQVTSTMVRQFEKQLAKVEQEKQIEGMFSDDDSN